MRRHHLTLIPWNFKRQTQNKVNLQISWIKSSFCLLQEYLLI